MDKVKTKTEASQEKNQVCQQKFEYFEQISPETFNIRVNPQLIKQAISQGFINELAFYYLLKHTFSNNGRIYNVNRPKERLSRLAGLSIPTINKYLKTLSKQGLIKEDPGGWQLTTWKSSIRYKIHPKELSVGCIKPLLYSLILEMEGNTQGLLYSLADFLNGRKQGAEYRDNMEPGDIYKPCFSVRYIAKLLNISEPTVILLIKKLNFLGVIETKNPSPEYVFNAGANVLKYLEGNHGYRYYQNGGLYRIDPARHNFLIHPVRLQEMTLKEYNLITKDPKIRKFADQFKKYAIN
jgi:DNA-binding Lrp family transcriptional regulator